MIEDQEQHTRCGSSLGHYFRGLSGQDMAGIDDIGGQVLPQGVDLDIHTKWQEHRDGTFYHFGLGKLASSAAVLEPGKRGDAICEIFGNYGWSEGVWLEKYLADHFMVRGVNHFVPHAFSAAPFPDGDCPPHFYAWGNNPQYRHFGMLVRYMERVCHLINGGAADARVGILYHAEADWAGGRNQSCAAVGRALAEGQIDYHFIPSDVFEARERYHTAIGAQERCLHYIVDDYDLYYVVNEAAGDYKGTLTFHHVPGDAASVYRYDAWTGECASVDIDAENPCGCGSSRARDTCTCSTAPEPPGS